MQPQTSSGGDECRPTLHDRDPEPTCGLALSGGGIRSATFNLGLLQALARLGILDHVGFVSTVSGGGYVGGFFDVWNRLRRNRSGVFPGADGSTAPGCPEPSEIRHLREHSRFLVPRGGVQHVEIWEGVVAVVGGMLPALVLAAGMLALALFAWRLLVALAQIAAFELASAFLWHGLALVLVGATLVTAERRWHRRRYPADSGVPDRKWVGLAGTGLLGAAVVVGCDALLALLWEVKLAEGSDFSALLLPKSPEVDIAIEFRPLVVLAMATSVVLLVRYVLSSRRGIAHNDPLSAEAGLERVGARILAFTTLAAVLGAVWWTSGQVPALLGAAADSGAAAGWAGGLAGVAMAAFGALTDWLRRAKDLTRDTGLSSRLRPVAPLLLANVAVAAAAIALALLLRVAADHEVGWVHWGGLAATLLFLMLVDCTRIGVRELYRRRIARAFLYASAPPNATDEQIEHALAPPPPGSAPERRPRLLVCCAANDLGADPLLALDRGARSAVICDGELSIGEATFPKKIRLSDALTASAAAVNSQMGSISAVMGPAVSFLLCALNLRLGLWVHLREGRGWAVPGWLFVREALGLTRADHETDWVHLSDGGHFENLGLYELIHRHCPYVIVSDCGADGSIQFEDLGNAIRRIREDFGVEIEIDVDPLRPDADGVSPQHAVVGTIHYDGVDGLDKGTILYLKPTLTGDEPPDIQHYRSRSPVFPHESTGDQFFDEAQWESYRRLGEHVGTTALRFLRDLSADQKAGIERIFAEARRVWHPTPVGHQAAFLALNERCAGLERELRNAMPAALRAELFPEVAALHGTSVPAIADADEDARVLVFLVQVTQVMEDAWLQCGLETHAEHPLNIGWMSYLERWAAMPSFRRWWPILRPIYSPGFREFMKRHFGLRSALVASEAEAPGGQASLVLDGPFPTHDPRVQGHAWRQLDHAGRDLTGLGVLALRVRLEGAESLQPLQVGVLLFRHDEDTIAWHASDLFVPAVLHGAGFGGKFLDAVLAWARRNGCRQAIVIAAPAAAADHLDRARVVAEMDLYRGRGFRQRAEAPAEFRLLMPG